MITMTEHCRGWVDAMLRIRPAVFETADYVVGYREGFKQRLFEAEKAVQQIREKQLCKS